MTTRRWAAALVVGALALTGCSAGADSAEGPAGLTFAGADDADRSYLAPGEVGREEAGDGAFDVTDSGGESPASEEFDAGSGPSFDVASERRYMVVEGELAVLVEDPVATARTATRIVDRAGGRIDERRETASRDNEPGSASLLMRIPVDRVDAVLDEVQQVGEMQWSDIAATDVTAAVTDVNARIRALEVSIDRLLVMLGDAERTQDLITLERTVADRQSTLESLQAQRNSLLATSALSSIWLHLEVEPSEQPEPTDEPAGFWESFLTGWDSLVRTLKTLASGIGTALPWLLFFGLVGWVLWIGTKSVRSRGAATAPVPGAAPVDPGTTDPVPAPVPSAPAEPEPAADVADADPAQTDQPDAR